jgi:hypothetical protein
MPPVASCKRATNTLASFLSSFRRCMLCFQSKPQQTQQHFTLWQQASWPLTCKQCTMVLNFTSTQKYIFYKIPQKRSFHRDPLITNIKETQSSPRPAPMHAPCLVEPREELGHGEQVAEPAGRLMHLVHAVELLLLELPATGAAVAEPAVQGHGRHVDTA